MPRPSRFALALRAGFPIAVAALLGASCQDSLTSPTDGMDASTGRPLSAGVTRVPRPERPARPVRCGVGGTCDPGSICVDRLCICSSCISGTWTGINASVNNPADSSFTTMVVTAALDGTIHYGAPLNCDSTISLTSISGNTYVFIEHNTSGGCSDGATVTATVSGSTMDWLWQFPGLDDYAGTLTRN